MLDLRQQLKSLGHFCFECLALGSSGKPWLVECVENTGVEILKESAAEGGANVFINLNTSSNK